MSHNKEGNCRKDFVILVLLMKLSKCSNFSRWLFLCLVFGENMSWLVECRWKFLFLQHYISLTFLQKQYMTKIVKWFIIKNSECIRVIDDKKVFTLKFHIDSRASYKLTISAGIRVAIFPNNLNQQIPQSTKEMVDRSLYRRCYGDVSRWWWGRRRSDDC